MFSGDVGGPRVLGRRLLRVEIGHHRRDGILGIDGFAIVHGRDSATANVVSAESQWQQCRAYNGKSGSVAATLLRRLYKDSTSGIVSR